MSAPVRPQDLVESALAAIPSGLGGVVLVQEDSGVTLRWAMNSLTTNGVTSGQSMTVAVTAPVEGGTAVGVVTRGGVGADDVADLVAQATATARGGAPAEDAAPLVEATVDPLWNEPGHSTGPTVLTGVSPQVGDMLRRSAAAGRESFGFALHEVTTTWLGTTSGLRVRHVQPRGTFEVNGKSHDRTRSTYVARATRDFTDIDVAAIDDEIVTRLGWQARRVEIAPGRYDTVLPATSVADLMIDLYWSMGARSAHEGQSAFARPGGGTRLGERLSDVPLTLASDPAAPGLECADRVVAAGSGEFASVFDNGLPSPAVTWLDAGVVSALASTRHSAALTGLPVRPMVGNLTLSSPGGHGTVIDLAAGLDRGLLVTSLWYLREVDPRTLLLTGLTRDGVYLVEGGEVVGVTSNFRFNESPVDLLARVQAVGASEIALSREWGEWFTRTSMPPLRVADFHMSTVSAGT